MQIVSHRPQDWFLGDEDGVLFLDVGCNHGAFGFSVLVRLTDAQASRYEAEGSPFVDSIARDIQNGGPSAFELDIGREWNQRFHAAVMAWQTTLAPATRPS